MIEAGPVPAVPVHVTPSPSRKDEASRASCARCSGLSDARSGMKAGNVVVRVAAAAAAARSAGVSAADSDTRSGIVVDVVAGDVVAGDVVVALAAGVGDGAPPPDATGAVVDVTGTVVVVESGTDVVVDVVDSGVVVVVASGTVVVVSGTVVVVVVVVVVVGAVGVSASDTSDGAPSPRDERARTLNSCETSLSRSVTVYDVVVDTPSSSCCHAPASTDISMT